MTERTEDGAGRTPLDRSFFDRPVLEVAPDLLGRVLSRTTPEGTVSVRLTEVEAYAGELDPASHSYRGRTARNAVMFGEPGHAYVYFTYGMHFCVNLVCGPEGTASAVLLRAGEIVEGTELARTRRNGSPDRDLARGPARLCQALGVDRALNGADVCVPGELAIEDGAPVPAGLVRSGPRTGVTSAHDAPWRFWVEGEPSVSPYRRHTPRRRPAGRRGQG
ncbi:DNA-3-methyladenine glycosylase [Actinocorallia sp. B10E7]|uniref:DNA-3-methyladenine glycosylase n=1 Tax=Actinocorallia sp. B10E7 TaxID=3153558 RepID=UPI00325E502D